MKTEIREALAAVGKYWQSLVIVSGFGLAGAIGSVAHSNIPAWGWAYIAIAGLVVACFWALVREIRARNEKADKLAEQLHRNRVEATGATWLARHEDHGTEVHFCLDALRNTHDLIDEVCCAVQTPRGLNLSARNGHAFGQGQWWFAYPREFTSQDIEDGTYEVTWFVRPKTSTTWSDAIALGRHVITPREQVQS